MALFLVERYLGEELEDEDDGKIESKFSLQEHIEQRRRKREFQEGSKPENRTGLYSSEVRKKKRESRSREKKSKDGELTKGDRTEVGEHNVSGSRGQPAADFTQTTTQKRVKKEQKEGVEDVDRAPQMKEKVTKKYKKKIKNKEPELSESCTDVVQLEISLSRDESIETDADETILSNTEKQDKCNQQESEDITGFTVIGGKGRNKKTEKVERALPDWLANANIIDADVSDNLIPVEELACLEPFLLTKLSEENITNFFPVQSAIIPTILGQIQNGGLCGIAGFRPPDLCVSAPTGSGKTLAYVLPIIQALFSRVVRHLRALILLPTKDLASQVKQVFEVFTEGSRLKVGLAAGNKTLAKEQESLVGKSHGSTSHVDILVATPGRLVEHITSTPDFTLEHLRFLVIDEADRLLDQSYHDWLNKVLMAAYCDVQTKIEVPIADVCHNSLQTWRTAPSTYTASAYSTMQTPLQKLLFTATMTHSPEKLAPLQLYQPALYVASKRTGVSQLETNDIQAMAATYTIPSGLTDYMLVCDSGEKPLVLLHLLVNKQLSGVLCFTSTLESTHRLYLLIKLYDSVKVAEYSSNLNATQRRGILRDFKQGSIQIIICSDAMARGLDIENVSHVISYDAPNYIKTYIHRVGRTARAGNQGTAITLLHSEEVHHFKALIHKTGREKLPKYSIKEDEIKDMEEKYQETLQRLEQVVRDEKQKGGMRQHPDRLNKTKHAKKS